MTQPHQGTHWHMWTWRIYRPEMPPWHPRSEEGHHVGKMTPCCTQGCQNSARQCSVQQCQPIGKMSSEPNLVVGENLRWHKRKGWMAYSKRGQPVRVAYYLNDRQPTFDPNRIRSEKTASVLVTSSKGCCPFSFKRTWGVPVQPDHTNSTPRFKILRSLNPPLYCRGRVRTWNESPLDTQHSCYESRGSG